MANHDQNEKNKLLPWNTIIKRTKANTNTIDTLKRILNLEGKNSNCKTLNKRFIVLRQEKGIYYGPQYLIKAVEKTQPFIKLGKVKRSGRTLRVPYPITNHRSQKMRINWLCNTIKKVRGKNKRNILAQELIGIQTLNGKSRTYENYRQYKKNLQIHKKNLRYRW